MTRPGTPHRSDRNNPSYTRKLVLNLIIVFPLILSAVILIALLHNTVRSEKVTEDKLRDYAQLQNMILATSFERSFDALNTMVIILQEQHTHPHFSEDDQQFTTLLRRYSLIDPMIASASILSASGELLFSTRRVETIPEEAVATIITNHISHRLSKTMLFHPESGMLFLTASLTKQGQQATKILIFTLNTPHLFSAIENLETLDLILADLTDTQDRLISTWQKPLSLVESERLSTAQSFLEEHRISTAHPEPNATGTMVEGTTVVESDRFLLASTQLPSYPYRLDIVYDKVQYLQPMVSTHDQGLLWVSLLIGTSLLGSFFLRWSIRKGDLLRRQLMENLDSLVRQRTEELKAQTLRLEQENEAHKRTEAALRDSEVQYRSIIDHSPNAIFINQDDKVILANEACVQLFGAQHADELLGRNIYDCFDSSEHTAVRERIHVLRDDGAPVPIRIEKIVRFDGTRVAVEVTAAPFPFRGSRAIHVILRDISERQHLEEQLRQSQKMESIGRLAGGVAHDFNNMLSAIIGYTELLLERIPPQDQTYEDLQEILKAANRSADLTRQLLAFSRKQTIAPKDIELNATIAETLKMLKQIIGEDIELTWKPSALPIPVFMDPTQIDQILTNLCINSRDAIDGVGIISIETATMNISVDYIYDHLDAQPGEYAVITVSDNGCGMDSETQKIIFEPFFSLKGEQGTGLGLSMVYGIIQQNKGFITVYSEPGKGTSFKIHLPNHTDHTNHTDHAGQPQEGDTQEGATRKQEGADIRMGSGETILIVEDEASIRTMAETILKRLHYRPLCAQNPIDALELVEKHQDRIDLLLTDVVMPEMNGRELAELLTKRIPNLKVLFMSGYTADVIAHQGLLESDINFIQKPFSINQMSQSLAEILGG